MDLAKAASARFFLELALGLFAGLLLSDRKSLGPGFSRLMAIFTVVCMIPAWLLLRGSEGDSTSTGAWQGLFFGVFAAVVVSLAGRFPPVFETAFLAVIAAVGAWSLLAGVGAQIGPAARALPLHCASAFGSMLVLGLVTGAMILGHWYLVTPDLPVAHLGRLTKLALASIYAKLLLLAATTWLFADRFAPAAKSFATVLGLHDDRGAAPFQSQLDFVWVIARIAIGLIGPAVLCHMTLATVRLKATQPATGILYAATVMVLMGELFALVGERSFAVVL